ncbi:hypothetical protein ACC738_37905, partial [Rhizobium ruizarguesonis]
MEIHARLGNTMVMITHDVDEAVLLSDRIVMMTNGPAARIGEVLDVMKITKIAEGLESWKAASDSGRQASGGTVRSTWKIGSRPRIAQTD